jgi:hypothetical protein
MPNTTTKEVISHEKGSDEAWICICGNTPVSHGFYACDTDGNEMVPNIGSKWDGLYVCLKCGRIIRQNTLEVIGQNPKPKLLP